MPAERTRRGRRSGPPSWLPLVVLVLLAGPVASACRRGGQGAVRLQAAPDGVVGQVNHPFLDVRLRAVVREHDLAPLEPPTPPRAALVRLGQALFFDKVLSGAGDISCATCHQPLLHTHDALPGAIGAGGRGLGPLRRPALGSGAMARNTPALFNLGLSEVTALHWDGRFSRAPDGRLVAPVDAEVPPGTSGLLAAQALLTLGDRPAMRRSGDAPAGAHEPLAADLRGEELERLLEDVMARLAAVEGYRRLFADAYPEVPSDDLDFVHAANALAAFITARWTFLDSPWDRFLAGDNSALSNDAKAGALLFFGGAGCAGCHGGALLSDGSFHNLALPQGRGDAGRPDRGRAEVTGNPADAYAFRTPALRNVALTGPWGHNGAYTTLDGIVRHHLDPAAALRGAVGEGVAAELLATLDPALGAPRTLSDAQIRHLLAFLAALTDPRAVVLTGDIPAEVPSGLPLAD